MRPMCSIPGLRTRGYKRLYNVEYQGRTQELMEGIGVARIFSEGGAHFLTKNLMTFF